MVGGEVVLTEIYLLEGQRWAWSIPTKRNKEGSCILLSLVFLDSWFKFIDVKFCTLTWSKR